MGCALKSLGVQSLALLAVAVLLLSSLGPMVDHHFAERYPAHGHLFLDTAGEDHSHPFEHSHIHYDAMYAPVPGDQGVVFFTPNDGLGHAFADIAGSVVTPRPSFGDDGKPLLGSRGDSTTILRGLHVSPLLPPPKA